MARYAAIDIGSNSVRMMAAEEAPGEGLRVLAADRQVIRLGESVFRTGNISGAALDLLCGVLSRMVATYQRLNVENVRVVATSAVRDASNQEEFRQRVSQTTRQNVEIISGQEEARLIHLGVQSRWPHPGQRILIIDVGGGSAELIASAGGDLVCGVSKPLGAVRLTETFLKSDPAKPSERERLEGYVREKLDLPPSPFGGQFDRVIATSASAGAVVCAINNIPRERRDEADRLRATTKQIRRFYEDALARTLNERKKFAGVGERRAEIIVAGACVFLSALEKLNQPAMFYSTAGLRDGILADLAARGAGQQRSKLDRDQRRTVEDMARRYGVALLHAQKVAQLACRLFEELAAIHGLPPECGKALEAAAYLHDVGHYVSDISHHKHSFYLVTNSDLPGFTDQERRLIALLCRYHRKALPSPKHEAFQSLTPELRHTLLMLIPLLRIADELDQGHQQAIDDVQAHVRPDGVTILLYGQNDLEMQRWAADRVTPAFTQIYGRSLALLRARPPAK